MLRFLTIAFVFVSTASSSFAELVDDPYLLSFADGAGSVAVDVPANTSVPFVFDLAYGSWSIAFVEQALEVTLEIDPMTSTGQLQPGVGAGDLDWTPVPGVITGLVRAPESEPSLFDVTVIGLAGGIAASSTSSAAFVNLGETPSTVFWRWEIEVDHVPEPSSAILLGAASLILLWRRERSYQGSPVTL